MAEPIYGVVRGNDPPDYNTGATSQVGINRRGDMLFAESLPAKTELVRLANSWNTMIPTGSAYTNVANMPTTRAELALYNAGPSTGKSFVIDQIYFLSLTSITAASGVSIIWQVDQVAALTDNSAVLINSPLGANYGGTAQRALAVTTMTANKWCVAAATPAGAAASIGLGLVANIDGGIIVSPGFTLGVNAVAGTATGTSLMGISWHEVDLPEA